MAGQLASGDDDVGVPVAAMRRKDRTVKNTSQP